MKKIIIGLILLPFSFILAGPIAVNELYFNEQMALIYLADLNFDRPESSPLLFEYEFSLPGEACPYKMPPRVHFHFSLMAKIPSLGWSSYRDVLAVTINPFYMKGSFRLSNRQMGSAVSADAVQYSCGGTGPFVDMNGGTFFTHRENFRPLKETLYRSGQLPAGAYLFQFTAWDENGPQTFSHELTITGSSTLELISPGSEIASTGEWLEIQNCFPVFQWESETVSGSDFAIRVCEYDPVRHSSANQALQDEAALPFPDNGGYYSLGSNTTFYTYNPATAGKELLFGRYYVWQIEKKTLSSSGIVSQKSPIYGFLLGDPADAGGSGGNVSDPLLIALRQLIGMEKYNELLGGEGYLSGYYPEGTIEIDRQTVPANVLQSLIEQLSNGEISIKSITVE
ncbi:MAG TPA: hypothetical protein ENN84_02960 [Candidatus Marinimicrobia bacterium]|nr:hypothetical protein [Candidatus Neomarinimicrobiota bacterium]